MTVSGPPRILVAGMGNLLRRDDGFGVVVAQRLMAEPALPAGVKVVEVGIGGIHLVQELLEGYDALVIVDAVERRDTPGTIHVLAPEVADLTTWTPDRREAFLADTHYTTPSKALTLARALGVLPPTTYIVGCQPGDAGTLGIGLSPSVARATDRAVSEIRKIVAALTAQSADAPALGAATA